MSSDLCAGRCFGQIDYWSKMSGKHHRISGDKTNLDEGFPFLT